MAGLCDMLLSPTSALALRQRRMGGEDLMARERPARPRHRPFADYNTSASALCGKPSKSSPTSPPTPQLRRAGQGRIPRRVNTATLPMAAGGKPVPGVDVGPLFKRSGPPVDRLRMLPVLLPQRELTRNNSPSSAAARRLGE